MLPALEFAAYSDIGRVRRTNQDAFQVVDDQGLVIVADGMGGHFGGEVASSIAVDTITRLLCEDSAAPVADDMKTLMKLGQAVEKANLAIRHEADANEDLKGMGTTVVACLFRNHQIYRAHVGDSRLYRIRDGQLEQLTHDHSLVQLLVDKGMYATTEDAIAGGVGSNMLTRGLGVEENVEVDVSAEPVEDGDVFLLCTDGLTGMLSDQRIVTVIAQHGGDLTLAAEQLIAETLEAGGRDNVTLILVRPLFDFQ